MKSCLLINPFLNYLCLHLNFWSVNLQSISEPLKQLSKVYVWQHSQKNLFGKLYEIIKLSDMEFIFCKTLRFQHVFLDTFRRIRLKYENYSLISILLIRHSNNIQTAKASWQKLLMEIH